MLQIDFPLKKHCTDPPEKTRRRRLKTDKECQSDYEDALTKERAKRTDSSTKGSQSFTTTPLFSREGAGTCQKGGDR